MSRKFTCGQTLLSHKMTTTLSKSRFKKTHTHELPCPAGISVRVLSDSKNLDRSDGKGGKRREALMRPFLFSFPILSSPALYDSFSQSPTKDVRHPQKRYINHLTKNASRYFRILASVQVYLFVECPQIRHQGGHTIIF